MFLAAACADDRSLIEEVDALIRSFNKDDSFPGSAAKAAVAVSILPAKGGLAGKIFGTYELKTLLGSGGMGEVYRAHDTKLGRDVAIKVLPREFTNDPDRLARFEREARVLATLNHPHIGAIYGLEEADGHAGLVLELVEGETLAERIAARRVVACDIPLEEALTIARQIADALEAAHEKGIVHRDLKPANIKITPAGVVKVSTSVSRRPRPAPHRPELIAISHRDDRRDAAKGSSSARPPTCRLSRRAARPLTSAPTSGPSAACSTRC